MKLQRNYLATAVAGAIAASTAAIPEFVFAERLTVEEVIVTARKKDEMQQDVPMTINAFTDDMLEERGIANLDNLADFTPGFDFAQAFGRQDFRPAIRGQSTIQGGANAGLFIDGFYIGKGGPTLPYGALQTIEVIKGPQSALFGRSTMAGVISYTLKKPTSEFEGSVEGTLGEDGEVRTELAVSGPLGDKWGYMASASTYDYDGQYRNHYQVLPGSIEQTIGKQSFDSDLGGKQTDSFVGVLTFQPNDDLELIGRLMYEDSDDDPYAIGVLPSNQNNCFINQQWNRNVAGAPGAIANSQSSALAYNGSGYYCGKVEVDDIFDAGGINQENDFYQNMGTEFRALRLSFTANWDINDYILTYNTSFHNYDEESAQDLSFGALPTRTRDYGSAGFPFRNAGTDLFLAPGVGTPTRAQNMTERKYEPEEYSNEFKFSSPDDEAFRYLAGVYLYNYEFTGKSRSAATAIPYVNDTVVFDPVAERYVDSWSVYGQIEYDFTDDFSASFELRYNEEDQEAKDVDQCGSTIINCLVSYKETYEAVLPRLSANWYALENHNFYGVIARGNKPGDFNDGDGIPTELVNVDEEKAWSYELGVKSTWLEERITTNVGLFYIDWKNQQLTTNVTPFQDLNGTLGSAALPILDNVGESEIKGIELEVNSRNTEWWDTYLGYSFTDTEIKEYRVDPSYTRSTSGVTCGTTPTPCFVASSGYKEPSIFGFPVDPVTGDAIVSGTVLPQVSRDQLTISNNFHGNLVDDIDWFFRIDYLYNSPKYDQVYELAHTGHRNIINLRTGINHEQYDVEFWVKNLENDDTPTALIRYIEQMDARGPNRAIGVTMPDKRASGVTVRYRF